MLNGLCRGESEGVIVESSIHNRGEAVKTNWYDEYFRGLVVTADGLVLASQVLS